MAQTIGANVNSLAAQLNSAMARSQWSVSMARLSSGLRVNRAKDAAAGLATAERFTAQNFQVGANAWQTIAANAIVGARASSLGINTLVAQGYANFTTTRGASVISTGNGVAAENDLALTTSAGTVSNIGYVAYSGADQVAPAINDAAAGIGITATANSGSRLYGLSRAGTVTFDLVGGTGAAQTAAISAVITDPNDLTNVYTAINAASHTTGIAASFTTGDKNSLTLTAADGRNISLGNFANSASRSRIQMQTSRPKPRTCHASMCCSKPPRRWWRRPTSFLNKC